MARLVALAALALVASALTPEDMESGIQPELGECERKGKMVIAVVSAPKHFRARAAIRSSWGADANAAGLPLKFIVGELSASMEDAEEVEARLEGEADVQRLTGFVEDYHNLTAKTLGILSFAYDHCYEGVLKVDDDTYVDVGNLGAFLGKQFDWASLYAGQTVRSAHVGKNPEGKWFAYDQFPEDVWPPYATGGGMFLGERALAHVKYNAHRLPMIRVEDAAVGVWVRDLSLNVVDMPQACYPYHIPDDAVWVNPLDADEMERLHQGERFTPRACAQGEPTACLCWDSPLFSEEEKGKCWRDAGEARYVDAVPR